MFQGNILDKDHKSSISLKKHQKIVFTTKTTIILDKGFKNGSVNKHLQWLLFTLVILPVSGQMLIFILFLYSFWLGTLPILIFVTSIVCLLNVLIFLNSELIIFPEVFGARCLMNSGCTYLFFFVC